MIFKPENAERIHDGALLKTSTVGRLAMGWTWSAAPGKKTFLKLSTRRPNRSVSSETSARAVCDYRQNNRWRPSTNLVQSLVNVHGRHLEVQSS
jgi:hypothetical protein